MQEKRRNGVSDSLVQLTVLIKYWPTETQIVGSPYTAYVN